MVKSYAQTLLLKDDPAGIAKYKEYHQVCVLRSAALCHNSHRPL